MIVSSSGSDSEADPIRHLDAVIGRLCTLPETASQAIGELMSRRCVAKGLHLLRAGEHADSIFFVHRGLLREYYCDANGRESTRQISADGAFSGSLADLLSGGPAAVSIEVLADSELLQANWHALNALADRHPSIMMLLRRHAEMLYLRKTGREFEMLSLPAVERYRRFVEQHPGLEERLSRHHLASYLGITPVHLGRITTMAGRKRTRSAS